MANYFEVKITFDKTLENGKEKKVSECYIVNAMSFTDAEAKITEHMSAYFSAQFEVKSIRKYKVAEIVNKKREYISRIENNGSNLTLKTLFDIVEKGLGGKVKISIET